ncbi:MAG: hypothetical protein QN120_00450 [Armatimonadota bacterium]|nr:hypothetical protein [Armatimonadota bacterium]
MSPTSRREYIQAIRQRYVRAPRAVKQHLRDEVCAVTGYQRKYASQVLNSASPAKHPCPRRRRAPTYGARTIALLAAIWEAAGYPWSARLKALLPLWLPWATPRFAITPEQERSC